MYNPDAEFQRSINTLNHEWGHTIQLKQMGLWTYIARVARPSIKGFWDSSITRDEYFNQPWERMADEFGGVTRDGHTEESLERALAYHNRSVFWLS